MQFLRTWAVREHGGVGQERAYWGSRWTQAPRPLTRKGSTLTREGSSAVTLLLVKTLRWANMGAFMPEVCKSPGHVRFWQACAANRRRSIKAGTSMSYVIPVLCTPRMRQATSITHHIFSIADSLLTIMTLRIDTATCSSYRRCSVVPFSFSRAVG